MAATTLISNGDLTATSQPPITGLLASVYSEVQNSLLRHSLPLPSVIKSNFSVVDGPATSAANNQGMDLSSEHKIVDLKNKIEASVIWRRKMTAKDSKSWGSGVSILKREIFEERAETILLILKQRFPGLPQSQLDVSKIQFNRDVGQAILESYSRTIETMAFTVMSRIDDVIQADTLTRNPLSAPSKWSFLKKNPIVSQKFPNAKEEVEKLNSSDVQISMTLSNFMGWAMNQPEGETKKDFEFSKDGSFNSLKQPPTIVATRTSYLDSLSASRSVYALLFTHT